MAISMKDFMKQDLKDRGTMTFDGIEKLKDKDGNKIPFIIKRLSRKEINDIRNMYRTKKVYKDKSNGDRPVITNNGQVAFIQDYDAERAGLEMMVDAFVQPKLDDPELMSYYGVLDRLDMPQVIFSDLDDFNYADDCLMIALGLKNPEKDDEVINEVKN